MIRLIAALDDKRGIAKNGAMPWNVSEDEQYFTEQTKKYGGHVLTGGRTWREAYKEKPLQDRINYVYTRNQTPINGVKVINDLDKFLVQNGEQDLWVAGGGELFAQMIDKDLPMELYLTHIKGDYQCDTFFPEYADEIRGFKLKSQSESRTQNGFEFYYAIYSNQQN